MREAQIIWLRSQMKAATGGCAEALSLRRLSFSCAVLLRSVSSLWLAVLVDESHLSRSEASYCHDSCGMPVIANCPFSWCVERFFGASRSRFRALTTVRQRVAFGMRISSISLADRYLLKVPTFLPHVWPNVAVSNSITVYEDSKWPTYSPRVFQCLSA